MSLSDIGKVPRANGTTLNTGTALTIFLEGKEGHSPQPTQREARGMDKQVLADSHRERTSNPVRAWLVKAKENITMAPRSQKVVIGKLELEQEQEPPPLVCIEPAHIPIEGVLPARALTRVECSPKKSPVTSQADQKTVRSPNTSAYVMLANFSDQTLTVPKSTVLGIAEEASEPLIDRINQRKELNSDSPPKPQRKKKNEALYHKLLNGKLDHLSQEDRELIEPILLKYAHVFHDEETNDFKGTNVMEHEIPIGDARPIRRPQYRTPYALRKEMQTQVENMLDKGVIRPSNSPWSAPAILVPKKSADGTPKYRFCVDFRALNSVTKFDSYPIPVFEEATASLHGSKYFTTLDCQSGFWQVPIREEHRERTGFTVPSGHYEFTRLPFGLSNSPSNFQRLMDIVLRNLIGTHCWIFIDDLIVFSNTAEEHAQRLEEVLRRLDEANLQLHPGKCEIAQPEVRYLGCVVGKRRLRLPRQSDGR